MGKNVNDILSNIKTTLIGDYLFDKDSIKGRISISEPIYNLIENNLVVKSDLCIDNNKYLVIISQKNDASEVAYLITYGLEGNLASDSLESSEVNYAHFLFLISELNFPCKREVATQDYLQEYLFTGESLAAEQYEQILPACFFTFKSYIISEQLPDKKEDCQSFLIKNAIQYFIQNTEETRLVFNQDTLIAYDKVINSGSDFIPYESILMSILENKWKFCYLDLFRCIERLFRISMTHEFKKTLNSNSASSDIACFVKKHVGEGHQNCQIQYLFSLLPKYITEIVESAFLGNINIGNIFYNTRNDIVHFQKDTKDYEKYTDAQWNALVQFSLLSIEFLYNEFDNYLNDLPDL